MPKDAVKPEWWNIEDWFDYRDYDVFSDITVRSWARVLWEMRVCSVRTQKLDLGPDWRRDDRRWWKARGPGSPYQPVIASEPSPSASRAIPLEELVVEADLHNGVPAGIVGDVGLWLLHRGVFPVLKVDLRCPDVVLVEAFRAWIAERRPALPLPITQRGHQGDLVPALRDQFRRWGDYRIAAVFDVDFWAAVRNQYATGSDRVPVSKKGGRLPTTVVADLVFPDLRPEVNRSQYVSTARRILAEALDLQSSVALQGESENQ